MNITVINGTNRINNKTQKISQAIQALVTDTEHMIQLITLENFDSLFRGVYIKLENANDAQNQDMQKMIQADVLLFVVPTYHVGIPTPLKNFLDSIKGTELYDKKVIGVISSNENRRDYGARQAAQVINGILAFHKLHSFVVPVIPIINHEEIDEERLKVFIAYCLEFKNIFR